MVVALAGRRLGDVVRGGGGLVAPVSATLTLPLPLTSPPLAFWVTLTSPVLTVDVVPPSEPPAARRPGSSSSMAPPSAMTPVLTAELFFPPSPPSTSVSTSVLSATFVASASPRLPLRPPPPTLCWPGLFDGRCRRRPPGRRRRRWPPPGRGRRSPRPFRRWRVRFSRIVSSLRP